jgi:phage shock protein C
VSDRLFRSPDDRVLAGVAGGMAETYDLDPALVRVGWALLALLTGGIFLVVYIVMALVVPLRPVGMTLWAAAPSGAGLGGDPGMPPSAGPAAGAPSPDTESSFGQWSPPPRHRHHRGNAGPLVIGLILIVVGGYFLARQFIPALDFSLIWPLVVIGGGVLLIVAAVSRQPGR